jgi:hypothetical protein
MKRKQFEEEDSPAFRTRSKKIKNISGTSIRNYMMKDTLVDWLKFTNVNIIKEDSSFLIEKGKEFEKQVISLLRKTENIPTVSDTITDEACERTIELMKKGVPIIHSAPFQNDVLGIKGLVDLLVRNDYLSSVVSVFPPVSNNRSKFGKFHYVVIDIKFSTLPLRSDGIHLLNSGNYPAYKGQLKIYSDGIGSIQEYYPRYAYILGRRWNYTSKGEFFSGLNCLDRLGVVDFRGIDVEYLIKTREAIKWLHDLKTYGNTWSLDPPDRLELYPNMCVDSGFWNSRKKEIADQLGDITQLWYCGIKERNIAIKNGVYSWRDKKCDSKLLGIGGNRARVVDKIIKINRGDNLMLPKRINSNMYEWRNIEDEIYIDFETISDIFAPFEELPEQKRTDMIFMIGVWSKEGYINFIANSLTPEEEYRIMNEFVRFAKGKKIWYWNAEEHIWRRAENRQMDYLYEKKLVEKADNIVDNWKPKNWCDLSSLFKEEPIVIKGCFKFGLKEISSCMKKHGFIKTELYSKCKSGLEASIKAWEAYQEYDSVNNLIMKDIILYNQFDVKVLKEILNFLRKKL